MGVPKVKSVVRLVKDPIRKNCCKDRSGGAICGSVYVETIYVSGRISVKRCYPNKHPYPDKRIKLLKKAA